jgi:predicted amidohydrolase YtcJ
MNFTIYSSDIFTCDPSQPWAEAIAVRDGKIAAVGTNAHVRNACTPVGPVMELPGRLVTPGFTDSHTHFNSLGQSLGWVSLRGLSSIAQCRQKIRSAVERIPPGEWIVGQGWNHNQWTDQREPDRRDLDDITPDHPVMMVRACCHSIWVNTRALDVAGLTAASPEPPGGKIDREPGTGHPTGLIREARNLIQDHIPAPTVEDRKAALLIAQEEALRLGFTGVHTMESLDEWEAADVLEKEGRLKIRLYHLFQIDELDEVARRGITPGSGSDHLWFGHAKLFADGSMGAKTALMHEPYEDDPSDFGIPFLEPAVLCERVAYACSLGWSVAIHAIGDKAVTHCLDAIAEARKIHPGRLPDRIEHIQVCRPKDVRRFHDLGVVASVQPVFVPTDWPAAQRLWGRRCVNGYAWKTILDAGIGTQFGSDCPIEPIDFRFGLHAAVTRQTVDGDPEGGWYPDQRLTLAQGIHGFTAQPALTSGKGALLGTLSPGKWADMTIFRHNLFDLSPDEWLSTEAEMTIVQGEIVFQQR